MKLGQAGVFAASVALAASALAQGPGPRRDGNWEVKMAMEMPGMPQGMPATTTTQCITKEQAADPQKSLPQGPGGRGAMPNDCTVSDYKEDGNKVTWSMKCEGQNAMTGTGEIVYSGDTYEGTMKMNVGRGGQPMAVTMKYSAKRLGDCTK